VRVRGARTPSLIRRVLRVAVRAGGFFFLGTVLAVLAYRFLAPPVTPLMALRSLQRLVDGRGPWLARTWVGLDEVSPTLLRSVIAAEDARFFEHHGIDFDAVARARRYNARQAGRRLRGASTITMQCARNVFLWQGRTYLRKALEIYFGFLTEILWGKRRILEVYVNVVEWGDDVFGVEAAARRYFGVHAAGLSPRQAALLAAALPNPRRWNPAAPTAYLARRGAIIEGRAGHVSLRGLGLAPWQGAMRPPLPIRLTGDRLKETIRPRRSAGREPSRGSGEI
jgi:monofunctional glycosyltransferase